MNNPIAVWCHDGYIGPSDGESDTYAVVYEVVPGFWTDSLTFHTYPGHE